MLSLHSTSRRAMAASRPCSTSRSTSTAGEAVGVIGPNGAGKTTLLRVISGLLPPSAGDDDAWKACRSRACRRIEIIEHGIAHVPESRRLFPRLTVEDNLRMGAFIPAARAHFAERLAWVYELFPAPEGAARAACRHALGRRAADVRHRPRADVTAQAVADGRALGGPGAARGRSRCSISCAASAPKGYTVLIVEQNVQQVLDVVDRAYLLEVGSIKLDGTAAEFKGNPIIRKAYMGL